MVQELGEIHNLVASYLFHRSIYDQTDQGGAQMGLGANPTPATEPAIVPLPVPPDAKSGVMDIMGEQVPTKEWHVDGRGHAVHVGDVDFGDAHVHGVTGHSKQSPDKAKDLVRRAVEHVVERMPFDHPDVDIAKPAPVPTG